MEGQSFEPEWFQESWPMSHECLPSTSIRFPPPTSISKERVIHGLVKDGSSKHIPSSSSALKKKNPQFRLLFPEKFSEDFMIFFLVVFVMEEVQHGLYSMLSQHFIQKSRKEIFTELWGLSFY